VPQPVPLIVRCEWKLAIVTEGRHVRFAYVEMKVDMN